jgi:hypothetical protein
MVVQVVTSAFTWLYPRTSDGTLTSNALISTDHHPVRLLLLHSVLVEQEDGPRVPTPASLAGTDVGVRRRGRGDQLGPCKERVLWTDWQQHCPSWTRPRGGLGLSSGLSGRPSSTVTGLFVLHATPPRGYILCTPTYSPVFYTCTTELMKVSCAIVLGICCGEQ